MIEQGIYFALGCIVTALGAMMFAPIFWRRALRLTRQRLQLQIPLSMQEIFAERDQLRAEFAVERLRIEQELERLQASKAHDMAELGRRTMEVTQLAETLSASRATEHAHKAEIDKLRRELTERDPEMASLKAEALAAAEAAGRLRRDSSMSAREAADNRARLVELQASQAKATAEIAGLKIELRDAHELVERLQQAAIERSHETAQSRTLPSDLAAAQSQASSLERQLADVRLALTHAEEREKSLQLSSHTVAEKSAAAARAASAQIEFLKAEKAALERDAEAVRHASTLAAHADADGGLRESIHALGLAVAAMTQDPRRPISDEAANRDQAQPVA